MYCLPKASNNAAWRLRLQVKAGWEWDQRAEALIFLSGRPLVHSYPVPCLLVEFDLADIPPVSRKPLTPFRTGLLSGLLLNV